MASHGTRRGRKAISALGAAGLLASAFVLGDVHRANADGGLRYEAHSTYTLDPAAGVVHVLVDMTLTNEKSDTRSGNAITSYYWSDITVPMLSSATNLAATRDGQSQGIRRETSDSGRFAFAIVDLSANIYYRDIARVQVTYDLPGEAPRSGANTRVNSAFATFLAFPVADPNLTSVRIVIPKSFDVEYIGADMDESTQGNSRLYESGAIADPLEWGVIVSARDDRELAVTHADTDDHKVEIRGWPDDKKWAKFVKRHITDGLPELEALIDLPWSTNGKLKITETVSPYLYGYAGWYSSIDNTIEIGDDLDGEVVLHEVSHIWFNDELFGDRWINEGFAQTYSNLVLDEIGGKTRSPTRAESLSEGAQPLNEWGDPSFRDDEQSRVDEEFGYNASWFVIDALTDEIGTSKMREVLDAAYDGRLSYLGDPDPEHAISDPTWKRLLDLAEEVGGSAKATNLFRNYVVTTLELTSLNDRAKARKIYDRLDAAGDGWTVPESIREDMTSWRFDDATEGMQVANRILDIRSQIRETLEGTEISLPTDFEPSYEGDSDLDELREDASRYLDIAEQLADADESADADHGFIGTIGLLGNDYRADLATAGKRFEQGKVDDAERGAAVVIATIDDANDVGQRRVLNTFGGIVLFGLTMVTLMWWRRRRRHKRAAAEAVSSDPVAPSPTGGEPLL